MSKEILKKKSRKEKIFLLRKQSISLITLKRNHVYFLLPFIAILVLVQLFFVSYTVDDAFISFRFAENLASGEGLVFNPGDKVEGYTNFLWTLMLGFLHLIGFNIIKMSKILGVACGIGSLWLCYRSVIIICKRFKMSEYLVLC